MIRFSEVLESLAYGELAQHITGNTNVDGTYKNLKQIAVISNLGLMDIYKKLQVKIHSLILPTKKNTLVYDLRDIPAELYLMDSKDKVAGIMQIVEVSNKTGSIPMYTQVGNTKAFGNELSVTIPNMHTLQLSRDTCEYLLIQYKPNPTKIDTTVLQNSKPFVDVIIDLPDAYLQALLFYVASKVIVGNTQDTLLGRNDQPVTLRYYDLYLKELYSLQEAGIEAQYIPYNAGLLRERGFV
jgi:hypothetical protein